MSSAQYKSFGYLIENKSTYHSAKRDPDAIERLWFMCGYSDSIYIVVASDSPQEERLVEVGMLLDIRPLGNAPNANSFFDFAMHRLNSLSERVKLCNSIRDVLARRTASRWCGAELESLFHRDVVQNAFEINGLATLGRSMNDGGVWNGTYPDVRCNDYTYDVMTNVLTMHDGGQKKLCALFHSVAIAGSVIVYVGSAPGHAWTGALKTYPNVRKVISIDPRPIENCDDERVQHHSLYVTCSDDLFNEIEPADKNCVLIWDIRGDASGPQREDMILAEISLLNDILRDCRTEEHFFLVHLKINMRYMCSYYLPNGGRYITQPFSVSRDVYEARYVAHLRSHASSLFHSPSEAMRESMLREMNENKVKLNSGELHERQLVANALIARYRQVDYIIEPAYNASEEEIMLFTINHNPPERVIRHLRDAKDRKRRYVVSFFSGPAMEDDPHEFPEGEVIAQGLGTVLDSRSIIKAKLDNLYFLFSDQMNDLFREEDYTSETYKIRKTEYSVVTRSRIPVYDDVRASVCAAMGARFPKFPSDFSISDMLISPSGHALRMVIEYLNGNASIAMFVEKIICNFRAVQRNFAKASFGERQIKPRLSKFSSTLRHYGEEKASLERSSKQLWHSVREWISGIDAALLMCEPSQFHVEQLRAVKGFIAGSLQCQSPGLEISQFYMRTFMTMSPLAAPRRGRSAHCGSPESEQSNASVATSLWKTLVQNTGIDPVEWLSRVDANARTKAIWRLAIVKLRADAHVRDYVAHRAYMSELTDQFPNHDVSRLDSLEFALLCYASTLDPAPEYIHYLHYWNNAHHPEHAALRYLFPNLRAQLERMETIDDVVARLSECCSLYSDLAAVSSEHPEFLMSHAATTEFMYDLLARRWQKEMPGHRGISSSALASISSKYIMRPWVDIQTFNEEMRLFVERGGTHLRFDVQSRVRRVYPHLYP